MECTIYSNTGFNAVNIPDSVETLNTSATSIYTTTALDCLQSRFLTSITISTTWENIKDADYCRIDDFYYFINSIVMTSHDVARLSLVPDFITSAGAKNLNFIDGVTERVHIPKSEDTYGAYNEADPLLNPAQPLKVDVSSQLFDVYSTEATESFEIHVVESSINLYVLGQFVTGNTLNAKTFTDANNSSSVTVPSVPYVTSAQACTFSLGGDSYATTSSTATALFNPDDETVQAGMQCARDLGIENAIIAQYTLKAQQFTYSFYGSGSMTDPATPIYKTISARTDLSSELSADTMKFIYSDSVKNLRALYGSNNKYGLLSASGDTAEYNPEDIYNSETAPSVSAVADGRYQGRPYFSFRYFHGIDKTEKPLFFFFNCVSGMEWRNLPLMYVTKSGSIQDAYNFQSERRESNIENLQRNIGYDASAARNFTNGIAGAIQNVTEMAKSDSIPGLVGSATSLGSGAVNSVINGTEIAVNQQAYNAEYAEQTARELYNFGYSQSVVTPTILFPYQTPSIRDFLGNGVTVYRYYLSDTDLIRIDKLLTAYGYKYTKFIEPSDLTNRKHFNYVKVNGVSVSNNLPNWWKTGITDQFNNGVRVWHVKPSTTYITERDND